jgi:hypothetical protein
LATVFRVKVRFCGGNRQTAEESSVLPWPCRVVPSNPPERQAASLDGGINAARASNGNLKGWLENPIWKR